jgi:ribosome-binding protein 1
MDLELGLIVLGVAGLTTIAVYLVSVMGIREKTFEEAIAEQKKRSEDLLGKKIVKKPQVKDKTKKKQNRKTENHKNQHHVEIVDEPDVLDESTVSIYEGATADWTAGAQMTLRK